MFSRVSALPLKHTGADKTKGYDVERGGRYVDDTIVLE